MLKQPDTAVGNEEDKRLLFLLLLQNMNRPQIYFETSKYSEQKEGGKKKRKKKKKNNPHNLPAITVFIVLGKRQSWFMI